LINENTPAHGEHGWFVSSFSNGNASCVQIKFAEQGILVRDSKDRRTASPIINMPSSAWAALLTNISNPV
jgi:hypothetical protein